MNLKKIKDISSRAIAGTGIIYTVGTVPITKDATPDLVKDMREHQKSLLQRRGDHIRQTTTRTYTPGTTLDKRTSRRLRK